MEYEYIVYVKTDSNGYITAVNSSAFLTDTGGWTEIDRGYGDKYHHAQNHYFPEPVRTMKGTCRYKMANGNPVECTPEETAAQEKEDARTENSLEERIKVLETGVVEMKKMLTTYLVKATQK